MQRKGFKQMDDPKRDAAPSARLRLAGLRPGGVQEFRLEPDAARLRALAAELDLLGLRKLRLTGTLIPEGRADWRLKARLGATVIQPCVATLAPVTTRIEADVTRSYLADPPPVPEGEEIEMPEDDSAEPLPDTLDLDALMAEELALNLPLYPHAEGVDAPVQQSVTEPGAEPIREEETKPFAGLAGLRDKLTRDDD